MYKRFFAFGCSVTDFPWTTWADIVAAAVQCKEYYNFGFGGCSNSLILSRVMEADQLYNFTSEDLVIVQWTSVNRESRYLNDKWYGVGNIYISGKYSDEFIEKYTSTTDFFLKSVVAIKAVQGLLNGKNVANYHISTVPITEQESGFSDLVKLTDPKTVLLAQTFKSILEKIRPSMYEVIYPNGWHNTKPRPLCKIIGKKEPLADTHPTPMESYNYIEHVLPELKLTSEIKSVVQAQTDFILAPGKINTPYQAPYTELLPMDGKVVRIREPIT